MIILDRGGRPIFSGDGKDNFDLSNRNIPDANMRGLSLRSANFKRAKMRASDLSAADIESAIFIKAQAGGSDFRGANCKSVMFWDAELAGCNFRNADLRNAKFSRANLTGSDLTGAVIDGAEFLHADLTGVKGLEQFNILPDGDLIVWKKLRNNLIAKLRIPADAKRISPLGTRICRAELAIVLDIEGGYGVGISLRDPDFVYEVGKTVVPTRPFDVDIRDKHTHGINFFLTRDEAVNY